MIEKVNWERVKKIACTAFLLIAMSFIMRFGADIYIYKAIKMPLGGPQLVLGRYTGATILGFKDFIADLLFLQADSLFWQSTQAKEAQEKLIPLIKVAPLFFTITKIDPHFIEAYEIGAWHFAWNLPPVLEDFGLLTDEKYAYLLDMAKKLLEEGVRNNRHTWELFFNLGWLHFQKTGDYKEAARWFREASKFPDRPMYVDHMLAHALEKAGDLEGARKVWQWIVDTRPEDTIAADNLKRVEEELSKQTSK